MEIYLDESGYTGEDLLNLRQPVFVIASTTAPSDVCKSIFDKCFSRVQASELKHLTLSSRPAGQDRLITFIHTAKQAALFATFVVHKEFALLTKIIDLWVEPAMHLDGIDLYERGGNIALANLSYTILRSLLPAQSFQQHLTRFQTMMRKRTPRNYKEFWGHLYKTYNQAGEILKNVILFFLASEAKLGFQHLLTLPQRSLDLACTCCLETAIHWRKATKNHLTLIHDKSREMARDKWLWDALVNPNVPVAEAGYDRRKIYFPLNVDRTLFVDSKNYLQLQYADLLAGATATYLRSLNQPAYTSSYTNRLQEAGIVDFIIGGIWPSADVTPEDLETTGDTAGNLLDFMAALIRQAERARKP